VILRDVKAMGPWGSLFRSRKFLLLILDVVVSIALYFVGKYAPVAIEDVKFAILTLQPLVVLLIGSIAYEDGAALGAPQPKPAGW